MKRRVKSVLLSVMAFVLAIGSVGQGSVANALGEACATPVTEYPITSLEDARPGAIVKGGDNALWFVSEKPYNTQNIGRITTAGAITHYSVPVKAPRILAGPDNKIWFTGADTQTSEWRFGNIDQSGQVTIVPLSISNLQFSINTFADGGFWGGAKIANNPQPFVVKVSTGGLVTQYPIDSNINAPNRSISSVLDGPDGGMWFTYYGDGNQNRTIQIVRRDKVTQALTWFGLNQQYNADGAGIGAPVFAPDGALWFGAIRSGTPRVVRLTTSGALTEYTDSVHEVGYAKALTVGADGNLWFVDPGIIGRVTLNPFKVDIVNLQTTAASNSFLGLTAGPDNAIWFTQLNANKIGRLAVDAFPTLGMPTVPAVGEDIAIPNLHWDAVPGATSYKVCRDGVVIGETSTPSYNDTSASSEVHFYTIIASDGTRLSSPSIGLEMNVDYEKPEVASATFSLNPVSKNEISTLTVKGHDDGPLSGAGYSVDGGPIMGMYRVGTGIAPSEPLAEEWRVRFVHEATEVTPPCGGIGCPSEPETVALPDGEHTITVYVVDWISRISEPYTVTLKVGLVAPASVTATAPVTNTAPVLNWSTVGGASQYRVYRDGGTEPIETTTSTTFTDTALLSDGDHTYRVSAADDTSESGLSQPVTVKVDKTAPTVSNLTVSPGFILLAGNLSISATASDSLSGIARAEYFIDTDPGQGSGAAMTVNPNGTISASKSIGFGSLPSGTHSVKVRVKDNAGNWSTLLSKNFTNI